MKKIGFMLVLVFATWLVSGCGGSNSSGDDDGYNLDTKGEDFSGSGYYAVSIIATIKYDTDGYECIPLSSWMTIKNYNLKRYKSYYEGSIYYADIDTSDIRPDGYFWAKFTYGYNEYQIMKGVITDSKGTGTIISESGCKGTWTATKR